MWLMNRLGIALSMVAVLTAGCVGLVGDDERLDPTAEPDGETYSGELEALRAGLDANRTMGDAPLSVAFALAIENAANGTPEWVFDPGHGDNITTGSTLPATVNHTYLEPGNYTPVVNVTVGERTAEANMTVTVHDPEPPDEDAPGNETAPTEDTSSPPDPVVIEATALVGNPAHAARCLNGGIDGDRHEIHPADGGWVYAIEPQDRFVVYWFGDDGFIEGGDSEGTVPGGATQAEVCMREGNVHKEYTLTLWHPDHEGASNA